MGTDYSPTYDKLSNKVRSLDRRIKRDIAKYRRMAAVQLLAEHPLNLSLDEQQRALKGLPFWGNHRDLPTAVDRTARALVEMRGQMTLFAQGASDVR